MFFFVQNWLIDDEIVGESDYLHASLVVDFVFRNEASRVFAQLVDHFKVVGQFLILVKPNRRSMLFAFIAPLKVEAFSLFTDLQEARRSFS